MRVYARQTVHEKEAALRKKFQVFFWLFLALALFHPATAAAQGVTVDGVGSNGTFDVTTGVSELTWSHTVAIGPNRLLIVGVSTSTAMLPSVPPTARVSGVTYGGAAMTRILTQVATDNRSAVEMFYLLNPPSGTANVVVT